MGSCPSEATLVGLLSGRLPPESEAGAAVHLESCPRCQQRADELSDDPRLRELDRECRTQVLPPLTDPTAELRKSLYALTPSNWGGLALERNGLRHGERPRSAGRAKARDRYSRLAGRPADSVAQVPPGAPVGESLGRFVLRRRLGAGSSGVVYLADDTLLERQVALKLPRIPSLVDPEMSATFVQEARAAALLHHPNIVPIFEVGQIGESCYLAAAYCSGPTLAQWFREQRRPLAPDLAARIILQLAGAVGHAHRRGILHRDLKPANVLLEPIDAEGEFPFTPKLTDFGLAKVLGSDQTAVGSGVLAGTPRYMAPEQAAARQGQCGPATDVYALGAIVYELLTGRPPIAGDDNAETLARLMIQEPPPVRRLNREVPRDLEAICGKCLQRDPSRRYEDAVALADDLQRFLSQQATVARPITWIEAAGRWGRRHPTAAALIGLVLAATFIVSAQLHFHNLALRDLNSQLDAAAHRERLSREDAERSAGEAARSKDRAAELLYASDLKLAAVAWRDRDVRLARELLMRHRPPPGEPDRRGFEWRYLWKLGDVEHDVLEQSAGTLRCVCFSPDGRFRASVGADSRIAVVDMRTSEFIQTVHPPGKVGRAAFSPDGELLATADDDGTVCVWEVRGGSERLRIDAHSSAAKQVVFLPRLNAIASCGNERIIRIWDARTGTLRRELAGHEGSVEALAASPDGTRLASASIDQTARIWDLEAGSELACLRGHSAGLTSIAFASDGRLLATGSLDQSVRIWRPASGELHSQVQLLDELQAVAFSPEGDKLVAGDREGALHLYSLADADGKPSLEPVRVWHAHDGRVLGAYFDRQSRRFISAGQDGRVIAWRPIADCGWHHLSAPGGVRDFAFVQPGAGLLMVSGEGRLLRWNCPPGSLEPIAAEHGYDWSCVSSGSSTSRIVAGALDGTVGVWESSADRVKPVWTTATGGPVDRVVLSPDGSRVAVMRRSPDSCVLVLDGHGGGQVASLPFADCRSVAFSPDAGLLAVAYGTDVSVLDLERNCEVFALREHTGAVNAVEFSPDGRRLASCGNDRRLVVWDPASGARLHAVRGYRSGIQALAFSPEGRTLLAGSSRGRIKAWRVATAVELCALEPQPAGCRKLAVSSDSGWTACLLADGRLMVHRIGPAEPPAEVEQN